MQCDIPVVVRGFCKALFVLTAIATAHAQPQITLPDEPNRFDQPLSARSSSLQPGETVHVTLESPTFGHRLYRAERDFVAGSDGVVDPGHALESLAWEMQASEQPVPADLPRADVPTATEVVYLLIVSGERSGTARTIFSRDLGHAVRVFLPPDVANPSSGLHVQRWVPPCPGRYPVAISLTTLDGFNPILQARLLAAHGFAVTVIQYAPPSEILNIPLEPIRAAIEHGLDATSALARIPPVLFGTSKAAELALLIASRLQSTGPVVGYAATSVVNGSYAASTAQAKIGSPWTEGGRPLPFLSDGKAEGDAWLLLRQTQPYRTSVRYDYRLDDAEAVARSRIPVEDIHGPVVLVSGDDDAVLPTARMANQIVRARQAASRETVDLRYADAGHDIGLPNVPMDEERTYTSPIDHAVYALGGSRAATGAASLESW